MVSARQGPQATLTWHRERWVQASEWPSARVAVSCPIWKGAVHGASQDGHPKRSTASRIVDREAIAQRALAHHLDPDIADFEQQGQEACPDRLVLEIREATRDHHEPILVMPTELDGAVRPRHGCKEFHRIEECRRHAYRRSCLLRFHEGVEVCLARDDRI